VTRRKIDIVAAWSVDRLGRSLQDLVGFLGELNGAGCDLYLERQAVDTTTPASRALFQMLGVFAEFERAIIQERINAGIARAREKGTKSGKPIGRARLDPKIEDASAPRLPAKKEFSKPRGSVRSAAARFSASKLQWWCGKSVTNRIRGAGWGTLRPFSSLFT
jgi:DNA invertase Pin-like site-specific DNA recombinase